MTFKNTKTTLFASLIVAMILPFSGMNYAVAEENEYLVGATSDEISEYQKVAPLLRELRTLDNEGRQYYGQIKLMSEVDLQYLEQTHIRIKNIQTEVEKISVDNRKLYSMDRETQNKFMADQKAFVDSDIEYSFVSVNQKTAKLVIALPEDQEENRKELKKQIENIIDVPFVLKFADFHDTSCYTRVSDCDPIMGGIEINDDCSISLPVVRNVYWWTEEGFLTAAHCTFLFEDIYQPNQGYEKDGYTTGWVNGGSCDCAFVKNTGSSLLDSAVWWSSSSTQSITTKNDPLLYDYVYMVGKTSGVKFGKIISTTASGGDPELSNLLQIDWFESQSGDSGGSIISAMPFGVYHGIVKGSGSGDTFASKWSEIDEALTLQ